MLEFTEGIIMFKLYLYGIEINQAQPMIVFLGQFKLYLYGIEIRKLHACLMELTVQIVPLWN